MSKTLRQFNAKKWATHYARGHYKTDPGIVEIHYLADRSPVNQIRLLEVNKLLPEIEGASSEPLTLRMDNDPDFPHDLSIIDVTPKQWSEIKSGQLPLPEGWSLIGAEKLPKARRRRR